MPGPFWNISTTTIRGFLFHTVEALPTSQDYQIINLTHSQGESNCVSEKGWFIIPTGMQHSRPGGTRWLSNKTFIHSLSGLWPRPLPPLWIPQAITDRPSSMHVWLSWRLRWAVASDTSLLPPHKTPAMDPLPWFIKQTF